MTNRRVFMGAGAALASSSLLSLPVLANTPIKLGAVLPFSGGLELFGNQAKIGMDLAVAEINAAGGILGRKINYVTMDTQSNPGISKALAQKAIDQNANVIMGPVFSGSIMVSMTETRRAEIPNFTGGEAASITQQGNPYIFRTSFTQSTAMPKIAAYIRDTVKAKTVDVIYVNNDFGKGGLDSIKQELESRGVKVTNAISTEAGQIDFSAPVLRARQSGSDALFIYSNEEESARALRELRKQGYNKPMIGETVLTSQKVIELAGESANGAVAHVGLTADAPQPLIKKFNDAFQAEFKSKSDHNGLKGYSGMYIVKAVTEKIGKFDSKAFAAAMKGLTLTVKDHPGILLDVTYDKNGDLDRESYMTRVENGKQVVSAILPAASARK